MSSSNAIQLILGILFVILFALDWTSVGLVQPSQSADQIQNIKKKHKCELTNLGFCMEAKMSRCCHGGEYKADICPRPQDICCESYYHCSGKRDKIVIFCFKLFLFFLGNAYSILNLTWKPSLVLKSRRRTKPAK